MKYIFFLRGLPGAGKSTWINENNLGLFTLNADQLRLQFASPYVGIDGELKLSHDQEKRVWDHLLTLLEDRMRRGELLVVDATHCTSISLSKYRNLVEHYNYQAYLVNFVGSDFDSYVQWCMERNAQRVSYHRVPINTIDKMAHDLFVYRNNKPNFVKKIIDPDEALKIIDKGLQIKPKSLKQFNKIVVFGDLHGCFDPLKSYFSKQPINEETLYVFVGDYIDRGIENKELLSWIFDHYKQENFVFLEGNHEKGIRDFVYYKELEKQRNKELNEAEDVNLDPLEKLAKTRAFSKHFLNNTLPQIKDLPLKELKNFYRALVPYFYIRFNNQIIYITHGGLPALPTITIKNDDYILGAGLYEDLPNVYQTFEHIFQDQLIVIHGHRNCYDFPIKYSDYIYNLCSDVEYGDPLRILEITKDGINEVSVPNSIYDQKLARINWPVSQIPSHERACMETQALNQDRNYVKTVLQHGIVHYLKTDRYFDLDDGSDATDANVLLIDYKTDRMIGRSYFDPKYLCLVFMCYEPIHHKIYMFKGSNSELEVFTEQSFKEAFPEFCAKYPLDQVINFLLKRNITLAITSNNSDQVGREIGDIVYYICNEYEYRGASFKISMLNEK